MIQALTERADQKPYLTYIRVALQTGQRPTAVIMQDRFAMHRDYEDAYWELTADEASDTAWTDWDYSLAIAAQFIEDYTDRESGQLYWYDQSDRITWETRSKYSGSLAAVQVESESRKLEPGETVFAVPVFADPDHKPTIYDWLEDIEADRLRPPGSPNMGHSHDEILDVREARAAEKAAMLEKLRAQK